VHYAFPKGSIVVKGTRIYGYLEPQPAVIVPWGEYKHAPSNYVQAQYTKPILQAMFPGGEFPNVAFTYHEMRFLDWEQMCAICKGVGLKTNREKGKRRAKLRKFFRENC
jgi:hypothetical protein